MKIALRRVAQWLGVECETDLMVTGWSVDSRTIQPGDLFFALRGPNHDGHAYVAEVFQKGAVGVVADRPVTGQGAVLEVEDSLAALGRVAREARQAWGGDVVGITGSAGKTTTKDVIASMMGATGLAVSKTEGNLNNQVGVPLSLLRLDDAAKVAVIEMGMNHAGEIRHLASIAQPRIGVVTNVGYAHIEFFESIEGIAAAKRELIEALPKDGIAVLNADDPRVAKYTHQGKVVWFGTSEKADVRAEQIEFREDGVRFRVGPVWFESTLAGRHNVLNILAGIVVAGLYGVEPQQLVENVWKLQPGKMRGSRFHHRGVLVYNDCYNSNPDAVRAMLDVLADVPARRRIAVLGEMLELGPVWAEPLHRGIGQYAAERGIDVLVGIRGAACCTLDAATRAGLRADAAFFFEDPAEAGKFLRGYAREGDAILFKGSRGVHVEKAIEEFLESPAGDRGGKEGQ